MGEIIPVGTRVRSRAYDHFGDMIVRDSTHPQCCDYADGTGSAGAFLDGDLYRVETDELATLRAFREQALARYPDLAEPESDEDAVERLVQNYYENDQMTDDLVRDAMAWARANPR